MVTSMAGELYQLLIENLYSLFINMGKGGEGNVKEKSSKKQVECCFTISWGRLYLLFRCILWMQWWRMLIRFSKEMDGDLYAPSIITIL